jgi:hypothetical protein
LAAPVEGDPAAVAVADSSPSGGGAAGPTAEDESASKNSTGEKHVEGQKDSGNEEGSCQKEGDKSQGDGAKSPDMVLADDKHPESGSQPVMSQTAEPADIQSQNNAAASTPLEKANQEGTGLTAQQ